MDDSQDLDLGTLPARGNPPPAAPQPATAVEYSSQTPVVPPAQQFDPRHLLDYVRILYKRRRTAVSAFVVVVVLTSVYTYTRVPIYQASARVLIEARRQNFGFKDVDQMEAASQSYYATQYAILQSRSLAKATMQKLGTWHDAPKRTAPVADIQAPAWRKWDVVFFVRSFLTDVIGWPGTGRPAVAGRRAGETLFEARQIDGFLGGLRITPVQGSSLVDVAYVSTDPFVASQLANAVAQQYITQNLESKSNTSQEVSDWLTQRMSEQREKVAASEQALQKYREENALSSYDDRANPIVQSIGDLSMSVTKAKTDRIEKEARYTQLRSIQDDPEALDSFPPVASSAAVQQARADLSARQLEYARAAERLGEKHPELQKARDAVKAAQDRVALETNRVIIAIRTDYEAARATEASMVKSFDAQRRQALTSNTNRGGVELAVLTRDLESNRQILDSLIAREKETGLTSEIKTNNVRILDAAEVPRSPFWPNTHKNTQYGLLGGALMALSLVFFFEYLDNRIKSPDEIKAHLGLPFLGLIPAVPKSQTAGTLLLNNGVPPNFAEAFRSVRTNVIFSIPDETGAHSILVTSAEPGEGKTMVSSNLAIAIAQAGQRVLLIDADMRRPRQHEVFAVEQEPGLSNFLVGDAKVGDAIRKGPVRNLWVLPSGRIPPNPAELLGSRRFKEFLARLDEHFDWVIVDTPPVMAVTDAAVVAHAVSRVVFVTSAELTNRHTARTAIEQVQATRGRFLGAILNRVDLERNAYYYSKYYRRGYNHYYRESSDGQKQS